MWCWDDGVVVVNVVSTVRWWLSDGVVVVEVVSIVERWCGRNCGGCNEWCQM